MGINDFLCETMDFRDVEDFSTNFHKNLKMLGGEKFQLLLDSAKSFSVQPRAPRGPAGFVF